MLRRDEEGTTPAMNGEVLVLNSDYEPLNVCNLRRAIILVYLGKAEVLHAVEQAVHTYEGFVVSPSVVKLRHHVRRPVPQHRPCRSTVRDAALAAVTDRPRALTADRRQATSAHQARATHPWPASPRSRSPRSSFRPSCNARPPATRTS